MIKTLKLNSPCKLSAFKLSNSIKNDTCSIFSTELFHISHLVSQMNMINVSCVISGLELTHLTVMEELMVPWSWLCAPCFPS